MEQLESLKQAIATHALLRHSEQEPVVGGDGTHPLPFLFDLKRILGDPAFLRIVADSFWDRFDGTTPLQICGVATAGYPLAAAIVLRGAERGHSAHAIYVRTYRKTVGRLEKVEGQFTPMRTVIVDDLINTGSTASHAAHLLKERGAIIEGLFSVVALRDPATYQHSAIPLHVQTLFLANDFGIKLKPPSPALEVPYTTLWRFESGMPNLRHAVPKSAPVLDETTLYVGSDRGILWALDQKTGEVRWHYEVGLIPYRKGIFSTPALHEDSLYFGAYDGNVYCLDTATGNERWVYRDADWVGSSPAIAPTLGLLFIGLEYDLEGKKGGIAALRLDSGEEVWAMRDMPLYTHCSPLYIREEDAVVIGSNGGPVYCFSATDGALRWIYHTKGDIKVGLDYDPASRLVFVGSFDKKLHAIDASTGTIAWTFATRDAIFSAPRVRDGMVHIASLDKNLYALRVADGSLVWRARANTRLSASPVFSLGSLWIGGHDGVLREADPATGVTRSVLRFAERITNPVAIDERSGRIFVPTYDNSIHCVVKHTVSPTTYV